MPHITPLCFSLAEGWHQEYCIYCILEDVIPGLCWLLHMPCMVIARQTPAGVWQPRMPSWVRRVDRAHLFVAGLHRQAAMDRVLIPLPVRVRAQPSCTCFPAWPSSPTCAPSWRRLARCPCCWTCWPPSRTPRSRYACLFRRTVPAARQQALMLPDLPAEQVEHAAACQYGMLICVQPATC